MMIILVLTLVAIGVAVYLIVDFITSHEKLGSKISGIWTNSDHTIRIMIYEMDSMFKAEIVWVKKGMDNLLGMPILRDLKLGTFNTVEGFYLCPFTNKEFKLKLKPTSAQSLTFYLKDEQTNKTTAAQKWQQVKP